MSSRRKSQGSSLSLNINPGFESGSAHELNNEEEGPRKKTVKVEVNIEAGTEALKEETPSETDERDGNLRVGQDIGDRNESDSANEATNFSGFVEVVEEEKGPAKGIEMEMVTVQLAHRDD